MLAMLPDPKLRAPMIVVALATLGTLGACTPVAPYERGRLAHPSMSANRLSGPGESHMQAVHEGAIGGAIGAESGCGCN
jgi:hypothetical protein